VGKQFYCLEHSDLEFRYCLGFRTSNLGFEFGFLFLTIKGHPVVFMERGTPCGVEGKWEAPKDTRKKHLSAREVRFKKARMPLDIGVTPIFTYFKISEM